MMDYTFSRTISIHASFIILRYFFITKYMNRIHFFYLNNVTLSQYLLQTTNILHILCLLQLIMLFDGLFFSHTNNAYVFLILCVFDFYYYYKTI